MTRDQIRAAIEQALKAAQRGGQLPTIELPVIEVLRPKQADHGDYSTNVAMITAAALRKAGHTGNPRAIAQIIADNMPANGPIGRIEIAGPGFINIHLADAWLQQQVNAVIEAGDHFGNIDLGKGARWQVEYLSANPGQGRPMAGRIPERQPDRAGALRRRAQRRIGRRPGECAGGSRLSRAARVLCQ